MFQKVIPLNLDAHRKLRFNSKTGYGFASAQMVSPVVAAEAGYIAREYVLVFARKTESLPLALLGVDRDKNAYVGQDGSWLSRYIPAHIRRYPFLLADSAENPAQSGKRRFTVMIDTEAAHFVESGGEALFDEKGEPAPLLRRVQEALTSLQRDQLRTLKLVAKLDELGVLEEQALRVRPKQGEPFALKGMRVINPKRFGELPADAVYELHRSGAMALAHAHFMSLSNLTDSLLMPRNTDAMQDIIQDGTISFGRLN